MNSARDAMRDELGTELLSQLAPSEQQEVLTSCDHIRIIILSQLIVL